MSPTKSDKTKKAIQPQNLAHGYSITISRTPVNVRSKGQKSRSQGQKWKSDRVASV